MKYLIVQDWPSTHGNHAGMVHMCNLLKVKYPNEYRVIIKDCPAKFPENSILGIRQFSRIIRSIYERYIYPYSYIQLCKEIVIALNDNDEVYLMEYLFPETSQLQLAKYIRCQKPNVKIFALSHLTPTYAEKKYSAYKSMVNKWCVPIDKILTLGNSLSNYFVECGLPKYKISTGFHYVDLDYYHKTDYYRGKRKMRVITIGAMARNFLLLSEVVKQTQDVEWIICKGKKDVSGLFPNSPNIQICGFLEENELRHMMDISDVSLSVMDDTIGSNVITTSFAMGLAQIVSDVGSIRDYCTEKDTLFCKNNVSEFVEAINYLENNPKILESMKKHSLLQAKKFSIENINNWFNSINTTR